MKTKIIVILDKSGSMQVCKDDTIGGFNQFLEEQKKVEGECDMTMVQFDNNIDQRYVDMPLAEVAELNTQTYCPGGTTALLDAIGITVGKAVEINKALPKEERPDKIIVLIMTDGQENASREFKRDQIKALIEKLEAKKRWDFSFVGANMDAIAEGSSLGIAPGKSANYDPSKPSKAFGVMGMTVAAVRSGDMQSMEYSDRDRESME